MQIVIEDVPVAATPRYNRTDVTLPLDQMQVGQSFKFPLELYNGKTRSGEPGGMKGLRSWLAQRTGEFAKKNGVKFSVIAVDDKTFRVGRIA